MTLEEIAAELATIKRHFYEHGELLASRYTRVQQAIDAHAAHLAALERVAAAAYGNDTHSGQQQLKCTLCQALNALDALTAQETT